MSVRITGLNEAIKSMKKKGEAANQAIIAVLEDVAGKIDEDAKYDAPYELIPGKPLGLKEKIDKIVSNNGLTWKVGVQADMSLIKNHMFAYAEFGTGLDAGVILNQPGYTAEIREIAIFFKKNGKGTLKGVPYLFPNYLKHTANLVEILKKEVEDALK